MKTPMIDSHVHTYHVSCMDYFNRYINAQGFDYINLACFCCGDTGGGSPLPNLLGAVYKLENPKVFAHAGLVYTGFPVKKPIPSEWELGAQAQELMDIGFDGIKILETKPTSMKADGISIADPVYDGFFDFAARTGMHLLWHACDPETFWSAETAPEFSFTEGWFYGDGTFPTKHQIYHDVFTVLDRHPGLNATLAHFFFLSDFPAEAAQVLDLYPSVTFDITPGREMYDNFTRRRDTWKAFFEKYASRILFGTDMAYDESQGEPDDIVVTMKRFLTTKDTFRYWDFDIRGLELPTDAVQAIEGGNFVRLVGEKPAPIDRKKLARYAERALPLVPQSEDRTWLEHYFEEKL